jgi:hypothetical protein
MQQWWDLLTAFEKLFWYISVPFSVILIIQIILSFIGIANGSEDIGSVIADTSGFDAHSGDIITSIPIDHDHSHEEKPVKEETGFCFLTLRNFIAFFALFGWGGIAGIRLGFSHFMTILLAVILGILMMVLLSVIFYYFNKSNTCKDKRSGEN